MHWDITGQSAKGLDYPIHINLVLESDAELADFYARMNIVGDDGNGDVGVAMLLAQDFDLLPEPDDTIFQEFYEELNEFIENMLEEAEDV